MFVPGVEVASPGTGSLRMKRGANVHSGGRTMLRSLLVPLDGSDFGEAALPVATGLAARASTDVHIVHVYDHKAPEELLALTQYQYQGIDLEEYANHYHERDREYLHHAADRLRENLGRAPMAVLLEGSFTEGLQDYVAEHEVDLIVMSTHGHMGLSRSWLGSMTDRLVRALSVPILLVRPREGRSADSETIRRILVPLDGSGESEAILTSAVELAESVGASLTFLHVNPTKLVVGARSYAVPVRNLRQRHEAAEAYLNDVVERLGELAVPADVQVRDAPNPAVGILEAAAETDADVIALTGHGRTGMALAALGSVADKVLRSCGCRVLLAPERVREPEPAMTEGAHAIGV